MVLSVLHWGAQSGHSTAAVTYIPQEYSPCGDQKCESTCGLLSCAYHLFLAEWLQENLTTLVFVDPEPKQQPPESSWSNCSFSCQQYSSQWPHDITSGAYSVLQMSLFPTLKCFPPKVLKISEKLRESGQFYFFPLLKRRYYKYKLQRVYRHQASLQHHKYSVFFSIWP